MNDRYEDLDFVRGYDEDSNEFIKRDVVDRKDLSGSQKKFEFQKIKRIFLGVLKTA